MAGLVQGKIEFLPCLDLVIGPGQAPGRCGNGPVPGFHLEQRYCVTALVCATSLDLEFISIATGPGAIEGHCCPRADCTEEYANCSPYSDHNSITTYTDIIIAASV